MKVRVRFAPSPTGGLHLGGVRTVLYNYLFARAHGGDFVLRIEDTDQSRFVPGAEQYIMDCLKWCGLEPDESPEKGGPFAPYRQSERKQLYGQYAHQLVASGHAYYAFDTPAELEEMRHKYRKDEHSAAQYDSVTRLLMRNSLTLPAEETHELLNTGIPHVIRIKMPEKVTVNITDMIRGEVSFDSSLVDDKVLLKADGMPTYHLAVVVDDYLMQITHAFRGEEWLPSAPVHVLLWEYLGWKDKMPQWAHLPLILKPDGDGKLSKRDGDRLGFPVFAMNWKDSKTDEVTKGFREMGFLPQAFVNMLAVLGWNDGTEQEIFSLDELVKKFSIERVHKGGAKFNFEKAKWFNQQYIQLTDDETLAGLVRPFMEDNEVTPDGELLVKVVGLIKERCTLLSDFWKQGHFFFAVPESFNDTDIREKWSLMKQEFFSNWIIALENIQEWNQQSIETCFKDTVPKFWAVLSEKIDSSIGGTISHKEYKMKKGDVMQPIRVALVGDKYGPGVFDIAEVIGKVETINRLENTISKYVDDIKETEIIFDANAYRRFSEIYLKGKEKNEQLDVIRTLKVCEQNSHILPSVYIFALMELIGNLESAKSSEISELQQVIWLTALHAKKENDIQFIPSAEIEMSKYVFGRIPVDFETFLERLGGLYIDIISEDFIIKVNEYHPAFVEVKRWMMTYKDNLIGFLKFIESNEGKLDDVARVLSLFLSGPIHTTDFKEKLTENKISVLKKLVYENRTLGTALLARIVLAEDRNDEDNFGAFLFGMSYSKNKKRVLVTDNKDIHSYATELGIRNRVMRLDEYLKFINFPILH